MEAYLDNSSTTRAFDEVADLVAKIMKEEYGNPSSVHHMGLVSGERLAQARETPNPQSPIPNPQSPIPINRI